MIKNKLVSIIMNCHNGEEYLKDAIQSVLSQTYNDWELIFWDNKSEDNSAKIFKSYDDKRFRYFYSNKFTSLYEARNFAIEKSEGEFIAFLDTDDMWREDKLELQIPCFENKEVGLVFSNLWIIKKNMKKKKLYSKQQLPSGNIYNELIDNYNIGLLTSVLRKNYFNKLEKKFDNRYSIIGDFDLFLRLAKICQFKSIQKPIAFYRLHGKNLTTTIKEKEVEETDIWLNENKLQLTEAQFQKIIKNNYFKKFVNYKLDGKYKDCINLILGKKVNFFNFKILILLFTPSIVLKKLLWFR